MLAEVLGSAAIAGAGALAWGVRGRSSQMMAPSLWRGPASRRAIALTFDDGPSESTRALLDLLDRYGAAATFFQCGHHARRLPKVASEVAAAGHEVGNHTDTHPALYFRSPSFMDDQIRRCQQAIADAAGVQPRLFRPPYGARWFGLGDVQRANDLTGVIWTAIARDWKLPPAAVVARLKERTAPGAILCLHDGRILRHNPDISSTMDALRELLPYWRAEGYELLCVSELTCLPTPQTASSR